MTEPPRSPLYFETLREDDDLDAEEVCSGCGATWPADAISEGICPDCLIDQE